MNQLDFDLVVNSTVLNIKSLLTVKGGEYAGTDDRLANFKRGAALTGCTPLQVLFVYLSKHYDGVASFIKTSAAGSVRPSSEPIEGRLDDLINYCILAKALIAEQKVEHSGDDGLNLSGVRSGVGDAGSNIPLVQSDSYLDGSAQSHPNLHHR